jgi:transcriptional regulator with XRE-family HTH domain
MDMRWPSALVLARQARGLTQRDVGNRLGMSYVIYGNRERGTTAITEGWLSTFLGVIGMTRLEFDNIVKSVPVQSLAPSRDIPLYPSLASAGQRAFAPEDEGTEWTETVERGNATGHKHAFAVRIHGDSMEPLIMHNDIVVCEPVDDEGGMQSLADGRIVVAYGGANGTSDFERVDGETRPRAKRIIVPEGGMIGKWAWIGGGAGELQKVNQKYKPVTIPAEHDGTIRFAVVVQLRRNV